MRKSLISQMMNDIDRLQEIVFQVLELDDPVERKASLNRLCGDDADLKRRVEELVDAHGASVAFLQADPRAEGQCMAEVRYPSLFPEAPVDTLSEGAFVGRYRLLEKIGEGGFGTVYMAEQEEPIRRKVAVKIIKLGMDTHQVVARFEAERQALALMDHPHVAKVLDGGSTESGRPFFVMELVRGIPITAFCEENRLTIPERLELFQKVCGAIQHAHQKGIIHRDIKPSNILVTISDGNPHPMVIDFGVAKAVDQKLTDKTLFTRFSQMIGTPAYMSPEQAEMSRHDVDTRADVYSLGILLYELLTGAPPFSDERLREAGYLEMLRLIQEETPARPSAYLTRLDDQLKILAANRRTLVAALVKSIDGDLDWIVLKAIDKDRNRRYGAAIDLARDIARHLSGEPVSARPPSRIYVLRKWVGRNRATALGGMGVALSLFIGTVVSLQQAHQARWEKRGAEILNRWVTDHLLVDPYNAPPGEEISAHATYSEALIRAGRSITNQFEGYPEIEADLRYKLGDSLALMDKFEEAQPHLRRAWEIATQHLGKEHPRALRIQYALASYLSWFYGAFYRQTGNSQLEQEGMDLVEDGFHASRLHLGDQHPLTLRFQLYYAYQLLRNGKAREAKPLVDAAGKIIQKMPDSQLEPFPNRDEFDKLEMLQQWRILLSLVSRTVEALQIRKELFEEARSKRLASLHPESVGMVELLQLLEYAAIVSDWERDPERALHLFEQYLHESEKLYRTSYPTSAYLSLIAQCHLMLGHFDEALTYAKRRVTAIKSNEVSSGTVFADVRWAASILARQGEWKQAADVLAEQRENGDIDLTSLVEEIILRQLEGNRDTWQPLHTLLGEPLREEPNNQHGLIVPEILVLVSAMTVDLPELNQWIDAWLQQAPSHPKRDYIKTLIAFRNRQWSTVANASVLSWYGLPELRLRACLTGYLKAISYARLNDRAEAKRWLEQSNKVLDGLLQKGDLTQSWQVPAMCLLLSQYSRDSLQEGTGFSDVTGIWMASNRAIWLPIERRLEQANESARRQDYEGAAAMYQELLIRPDLNGKIDVFSDQDIRKMALAFILTQRVEDYRDLCSKVYEGGALSSYRSDVWPLCFQYDVLPEDLQRSLVAWSDSLGFQDMLRRDEPNFDVLLDNGLSLFQAGRFDEAIQAFDVVTKAPHPFSRADLAAALRAICQLQLGNDTNAKSDLKQLHNQLDKWIELGDGRMDPDWVPQAWMDWIIESQIW